MILTVDIGNSRIKWALWRADKIVERGVAAYATDNHATGFDELFSKVEKPAHIFVVCVAGNTISHRFNEWSKQRWQLGVEFLNTEKQFNNIINAYKNPEQHGVDRWAGIVASHQRCPGFSVCVINAGTATTFDLINKDGRHLGGYILPSYVTMHKAILADTANVKSAMKSESDMQFDVSIVPDNTNDAVNQGLHKLLQAGIREICQFAKQKMEAPMQIIISGGFAKIILSYPDMPDMIYQPDLVMQGLYEIMKQRMPEGEP